jgi:hypothetical protein
MRSTSSALSGWSNRSFEHGRVHPEIGLGVQGGVAPAMGVDALDVAVHLLQPTTLGDRTLGSVDLRHQGLQRAVEPAPGVGLVDRVLTDAGADHRVGHLEDQRPDRDQTGAQVAGVAPEHGVAGQRESRRVSTVRSLRSLLEHHHA